MDLNVWTISSLKNKDDLLLAALDSPEGPCVGLPLLPVAKWSVGHQF
jgi:hypothetical protein